MLQKLETFDKVQVRSGRSSLFMRPGRKLHRKHGLNEKNCCKQEGNFRQELIMGATNQTNNLNQSVCVHDT